VFRLASGASGADLVGRLKARGVLANALGPDLVRLVTHRDVSRAECVEAAEVMIEEIEAAQLRAVR
jgi:threonine aldolase